MITKIYTDFRTNRILTNKLVTACQGVPVCRIAVSNPLETLSQLISKLQSSIIAWEKEHPSQETYTTFTDHCYCNQDQGQNYNRNFSFKAYNPIGVG